MLNLNESGAQPLTLSRSERLELGPRSGFGFLAPPVRNGSRGGGGGGAASVGGGAGSARPQDMAHNKIPPRWLNCPRRGQPVAGNPDGGRSSLRALAGPGAGRLRGAAFGVCVPASGISGPRCARSDEASWMSVWELGLERVGQWVEALVNI